MRLVKFHHYRAWCTRVLHFIQSTLAMLFNVITFIVSHDMTTITPSYGIYSRQDCQEEHPTLRVHEDIIRKIFEQHFWVNEESTEGKMRIPLEKSSTVQSKCMNHHTSCRSSIWERKKFSKRKTINNLVRNWPNDSFEYYKLRLAKGHRILLSHNNVAHVLIFS